MFDIIPSDKIKEHYSINDPWDYVTSFENAIKEYCGYEYAVACDSNTNAIRLCFEYLGIKNEFITIPKRTYVSVPNQIIHSGNIPQFQDIEWEGEYEIGNTGIIDSACKLERNSSKNIDKTHYKILSFHHRKIINIGKGGMILTNDPLFEKWARTMIYDGRHTNLNYRVDDFSCHGWHMYMTPEDAYRGLKTIHSGKINSGIIINSTHKNYKDLSTQKIFDEKRINNLILDKWDINGYENDIEKIINNTNRKYIHLIQPQEHFMFYGKKNLLGEYQKLNNKLKELDKKLVYYCGSDYPNKIAADNIEIVKWDSIDYFIKSKKYNPLDIEISKTTTPTHHFSIMTFIKGGREWRTFIAENIFSKELDKSTSLCLRIDDEIKSRGPIYHSANTKDEFLEIKTNKWNHTTDIPYPSDITDELDTLIIPNEYNKGALDIVVETITDYFFFTEKTLRPIITYKPFIVFGSPKYHQILRDRYGFKLYDNVIDYSFDDIENFGERYLKIIEELDRIRNTYTPMELRDLTKVDVEFNFNRVEWFKSNNSVPQVPDFIYQTKRREYRND